MHTNETRERFFSKIEYIPFSECLHWVGAHNKKGYGFFSFKGKKRPAHQIAWELEFGRSFPVGKIGCHTCDRPSCVNPLHIFPGTYKENTQDMIKKNRHNFSCGYRGEYKKAQTHCIRGHEFTIENTKIKTNGCRQCRACYREIDARRRARNRKAIMKYNRERCEDDLHD